MIHFGVVKSGCVQRYLNELYVLELKNVSIQPVQGLHLSFEETTTQRSYCYHPAHKWDHTKMLKVRYGISEPDFQRLWILLMVKINICSFLYHAVYGVNSIFILFNNARVYKTFCDIKIFATVIRHHDYIFRFIEYILLYCINYRISYICVYHNILRLSRRNMIASLVVAHEYLPARLIDVYMVHLNG